MMHSNRNRKRGARGRGKGNGKGGGAGGARGVMMASAVQTGLVVRNMPLFPYKCRRNLNYVSTVTVTSGTSGTAASYVFSANGIYDPDISGAGGQPMGFDQIMVFYNHYTVHRSMIRVVAANASATVNAFAGIYVSGNSTGITSVEQIQENGDAEIQQLTFKGAFGSICKLQRRLDVGKFQAVDDVMDDPNMRGDVASNPAEQAYYHICAFNNFDTSAVTLNLNVCISYDVTFHEPRKATISETRRENLQAMKRALPTPGGCDVHVGTSSARSSSVERKEPVTTIPESRPQPRIVVTYS